MHLVDVQEKTVTSAESEKRLDRQKWHKPLVSIVVTHYNYSNHLEDALLSILDQTHENWECVVVDDASAPEHRAAAETIVNNLGGEKIRFLPLQENVGQVGAFFAGLAETTGEFVCILDPDDRYETTFLEEMLKAHLNNMVFCPLACCDQRLLKNGAVMTGVYSRRKMRLIVEQNGLKEVPAAATDRLFYFPPDLPGWHWTSTSSMMFRRAVLNLLRPYKPLAYKRAVDAYTAFGAHRLGGSLLLTTPLVYRGIHDENSFITNAMFASVQNPRGPQGEDRSLECLNDVLDAISYHGAGALLPASKSALMSASKKRRGVIARWGRSIEKRRKKLRNYLKR